MTEADQFTVTRWSLVLQANGNDSLLAAEALAWLCRAYWFPLYTYVRRQGYTVADAQDLTQEFFARMLERGTIRLADRARGRFRTYLLTSMKHFLINQWTKANRQKRGGGRQIISFDGDATETRFLTEPPDGRSPDTDFDRRWAITLLGRVLERLEGEWAGAGREHVFRELKGFLTGDDESTYAEAGARLGISEGNLKVTIHRLRRRYRELLREEIAGTVANRELIDEEIAQLFEALSR